MNQIMKYFEFSHLPEKLQDISKPIGDLAKSMDAELPDSAEKSAGFRKLLEAKDCFVRAALPCLLLVLFCGCVAPADDSRAISVSRTGWLDNKVQGLADRSMDRARETILIPALQGMVDGLKNQQRSESATTHSVGVLLPDAEVEAKESREVREVQPTPQSVVETDQPDDVLTVRECTGNQCFGVFTVRRRDLAAIETQAGFRGRKVTVLGVKRSVSVIVQPVQVSPPVVANSPAVIYSARSAFAFSASCNCDNCQCRRAAMLPNYSASAAVTYDTPIYTTTYRTRWRPFSRWR